MVLVSKHKHKQTQVLIILEYRAEYNVGAERGESKRKKSKFELMKSIENKILLCVFQTNWF